MDETPGNGGKSRRTTKKKAPQRKVVSEAPVRAFFDGDHEREVDNLEIRDQVNDFARLITGRDVRLPLSLGLFGNWGVGKTHFMELLQSAVTYITDLQEDDDAESTYVRRVAQIKFNAWHFVDTNIWASMATTIFDGIAEEYAGGPNANYLATLRAAIRKELKSSESAILEATERQRLSRNERVKASEALDDLRTKRSIKQSVFDRRRFERLLQVKMSNGISVEAGIVNKATDCAKQLGITNCVETAEDAKKLADQLTAMQGSANCLLAALNARFTGPGNAIVTILVAGGFIFGAWGLAQLWEIFATLKGFDEDLAKITSATTQLAAVVLPAMGWLGKKMSAATNGLNLLTTLKNEWDRLPPDPAEAPLVKAIQILDAEIKQNRQLIIEAEGRLRDAQAEMQAINSGSLVYDFVLERGADDEYKAELGIIATVRSDFEKLQTLLDDWNANAAEKFEDAMGASRDTTDAADKQDAEGEDGKEAVEDDEFAIEILPQKKPIERIILYIDDLDRCHPDKVVQILQAVHLLLAFDLFVVVVAVDPRWLERSLYRTYAPETIENSGVPESWNRLSEFSPQNYLEKIFQIPFSLAAMSPVGYRKLVSHLVQSSREVADDDWSNPGDSYEGPSDSGIKPLEGYEKEFLQCLEPFVSTPRLAKRMVNIYRLLRVRAGHPEFGFDAFIDAKEGEYRAALILLALNTAYGRVASKLIHALGTGEVNGTWAQFLEHADPTVEEVKRTDWARDMKIDDCKLTFREMQQALAKCRKNLTEAAATNADGQIASSYPSKIDPYVKWAPEVGRYSFHWYLN